MQAIRRHFNQLYSVAHPDLGLALQALVPPVLGDPRIVALNSSAFLTLAGWQRLLLQAQAVARRRQPCAGRADMLDAGCGRGRVGWGIAASIDASLTGIDFAQAAIDAARADPGLAQATFVGGDIFDMPFVDASFDLVCAIETLHLLEDPLPALREVRRVLRDGGTVIGSVYRLAGRASDARAIGDWKNMFEQAGFRSQEWLDVTAEWRTVMREKHARRWAHRDALVEAFGEPAMLECDVSRQMLGLSGAPGFIDRNQRFEFQVAC